MTELPNNIYEVGARAAAEALGVNGVAWGATPQAELDVYRKISRAVLNAVVDASLLTSNHNLAKGLTDE